MADIIGLVTVNEKDVLEVSAAPGAGAGTPAPVGSLALFNDAGVGKQFIKVGAADTEWDQISTVAGGNVGEGVKLRLALYDVDGYHVDDLVQQNAQDVTVAIEAQATRTVDIAYTIPNPGDAIAAAEFVLSEGDQSINGSKTFNDDTIVDANLTVEGDLTVNGTLTYLNSTNTEITDKNVILNKGGAAASAGGAGLDFEEDSAIAGWFRVAGTRDGFEFLSPAVASKLTLDLGDLSADRVLSAPNESGTAVIHGSSDAGVLTQIPVYATADRITSFDSFVYSVAGGLQVGAAAADLATLKPGSLTIADADAVVAGSSILGYQSLVFKDGSAATLGSFSTDGTDMFLSAAADLTLDANAALALDGATGLSLSSSTSGDVTLRSASNLFVYKDNAGPDVAQFQIGVAGDAVELESLVGSLTLTSAADLIVTGFAKGVVLSDASGVLSSSTVDLADSDYVGTSVLPIANGGTNSSTALNANRLMYSVDDSGVKKIVEYSALQANQLYFGAAVTGLPAQSADLHWDITNGRLGIGTAAPAELLDVDGSSVFRGSLLLSSAAATDAKYELLQDAVSTTDDTLTTLATVNLATDSSILLEARIVGRDTTTGDSAIYVRTARFKNVGGVVTRHNLQTDYTSEDVALWDGTIVASGTNALIRVKGGVAANVDWSVTYIVQELV